MYEFIGEFCENGQTEMEDAIETRIYASPYVNSVREALNQITPEGDRENLMWELGYHKGMTDVVNHINNSNLTDSQKAVKYIIEETKQDIVMSETMRYIALDDIDDGDIVELLIDYKDVKWEEDDIDYFELEAKKEDFGYGLWDENGDKQGHIDSEDVVYYKSTD